MAYSLLEKPHVEGAPGSGTGSAQALIQAGVGSLIVNHIGPKAFMILQRANITVYSGAEGKTVAEAIKMFRAQQITKLELANN
jgi:predicted Fe-Mo cluster-binding NifX family protein